MFDIGLALVEELDVDLPLAADLPLEPWNRPTSAVRPDGYAALEQQDATRRPADRADAIDRATVGPVSTWAPDEIGLALALALSRGTASDRIERAIRLTHALPATLAAWDAGQLDAAKVNAIHDATLYLSEAAAQAVQDRVLPTAPTQTVAQLRG